MKLNKKLMMAALAGAIVVSGSTGVFAESTQFELDPNAPGIPKAVDSESKLMAAKEEAIKELKAAGVTSDLFLNQIRKAKSIASVNALKAELLKSHEASKPRVTIDQWNLKNAKEDAIKELKAAGITSDFLLNRIRSAKTIEGVNSLKAELLKAHKKPSNPEVKPNPSKPERQPSTPEGPYAPYAPEKGKEEKPGKDQKPEQKPGEDKKPENKKPENKKPEDKKPENKKPNNKKQNTDSPKKKEKAELPKAGSEAEILTLAAAALSTAAGAYVSIRKRK